MTSRCSKLPGAVAGDGIDAPVAAHYGSLVRRAAHARRRVRASSTCPTATSYGSPGPTG